MKNCFDDAEGNCNKRQCPLNIKVYAMDWDGSCFIFNKKPIKNLSFKKWIPGNTKENFYEHIPYKLQKYFPPVSWEDDEPIEIRIIQVDKK